MRVFSWSVPLASVKVEGDSITVRGFSKDVAPCVHTRVDGAWRIVRGAPIDAASTALAGTVELSGARPQATDDPTSLPQQVAAPAPLRLPAAFYLTAELGESHYRSTEESWQDAGRPSADVSLWAGVGSESSFTVAAFVKLDREPVFAARADSNPLDNELPDVNSDGVQLHFRSATTSRWNSLIAVPDGDAVRLTAAEGAVDGVTARWERTPDGYSVYFTVPWPDSWPDLALDVIVNDRPAGRERRRGQLVLSGARGESAYLRGARQAPDRALHFAFDPAQP